MPSKNIHLSLKGKDTDMHRTKKQSWSPGLARVELITWPQALWQRLGGWCYTNHRAARMQHMWAAMMASSYHPDWLNREAGDGCTTWLCSVAEPEWADYSPNTHRQLWGEREASEQSLQGIAGLGETGWEEEEGLRKQTGIEVRGLWG